MASRSVASFLAASASRRRAGFPPSDLDWIVPVATIAGIQIGLWFIAWRAGFATQPVFRAHGVIAYTILGIVGLAIFLFRLWQMARRGEPKPINQSVTMLRANSGRIVTTIIAVQIFALGSAAFQAMKTALPAIAPFWLDAPLARWERMLFGIQPWEISQALLGWATPAIDFIYATWLAVQIAALYMLLLLRPSELKSQALVTLSLAWLILGIGGAYLFSSAGPIFYDRIYGGHEFAGLGAVLQDAPVALRTSNMLWRAYALQTNEIASGISAVPSMHVALALWLALIVRGSRGAAIAWTYFVLICLGSVHLGWHYVSDGVVGALGMLLLWHIVRQARGRGAGSANRQLPKGSFRRVARQ